MIKTALEVKEPLTYIFKNTESKEYKRIFLTPAEWITLQQLEKVFSVLVQLTVFAFLSLNQLVIKFW